MLIRRILIRRAGIALISVLVVLTAAGAVYADGAAANLVFNGDFAHVADGKPTGWEADGDTRSVDQTLDVTKDSGRTCARLRCTRFQGAGGAAHAMVAQVGRIRLEQGKSYAFSCLAREEGVRSRSATVAIQDMDGWQPCGLYTGLPLDRAWKPFRIIFRATRSVEKTGRLQIWFTETGTLFLADARISEITAGHTEFTDMVPPAGGKNPVPNSSFALGASGWSSLGIPTGWGDLSRLHGQTIAAGGPDGGAFLRIPMGGGRTPVLYFDYYQPSVTPQTRCLAASLGWIPVQPGASYTVSCWIRSNSGSAPALVGVVGSDPDDSQGQSERHETKVEASGEWRRYSCRFTPKKRYVFVVAGPDLPRDTPCEVDVADVELNAGDLATPYEPRAAVEVAIEPSSPGGIFEVGKPSWLVVLAANHSSSAASVPVSLEARDYWDRARTLPPVTLRIPPRGTSSLRIPISPDWRGFYRVHARWTAAGRAESRDVRLAIVPHRTSDDSVLGINHAFPSADLIHLASKAGVTWYRDWSLKWQHIEPSPGDWRWGVGDAQIDRVRKEGAKLMALLPPFPSAEWSSEAPATVHFPGGDKERMRQAWSPKEPALLAAFVEKAAARYRDRVPVFEFLNEPIYTDYALPGEPIRGVDARRYTPADYVSLLRVAAEAIRRGAPGSKLIGGIASGPLHYTHELLEAGILPLIDILNLHIYPGSRAPEGYLSEMNTLLRDMDSHGGRKPIWITEFSYYAVDDLPRKPFVPGGDWAEARFLPSERECAEYTVRFIALMLARGVQKVFIHSGASGAANDTNSECCLFAYGGAPRKVLPALSVLTELLGPHPRFVGEKAIGEEGHALAFETGTRSVIIAWTGSEASVPVRTARARCLDIMGESIAPASLQLSSSPVYLRLPPNHAREALDTLSERSP